MHLHSFIVDDFLEDYPRWREWLDTAEYADIVNEVDGVTYQGICSDIPAPLRGEILYKLQAQANLQALHFLFARLSTHGVMAPHYAHNDASMGIWSMMLYMNRPEDCQGGTAMLEHVNGEPDFDTWRRDTNDTTQWRTIWNCPMVSNRAFIFRAGLMHAALPRSGFGSTPQDGRVVLTAFFS